MGVYLPNKRLPDTYQEVEYIQSSGTQWINSQYTPTTNSRFNVKYNIPSKPNEYGCLFGARNVMSSTDNSYYLGWRNLTSKKGLIYIFGPSYDYGGVTFGGDIGVDYDISYVGSNLTDGTNSVSISYTSNPTGTLYIFGCHDIANNVAADLSNAKLYNLKLYDGTTLVRDFVPCYRKSDSVIGMYDLVNNQFYTNSGSGTFSKGADVVMTELKNAYIGEVYEYSYTFKGKTATEIGNEWTNMVGGYTVDSNGVTGVGLNNDCRIAKSIPSLAHANRIIISGTVVANNATQNAAQLGIGMGTGWGSGWCGYQVYGSYFTGLSVKYYDGSDHLGNRVGDGVGGNTYKPTTTIDLENKVITGVLSGFNNSTFTLTDADVTYIRQFDYVCVYTSSNWSSVSDISITIE